MSETNARPAGPWSLDPASVQKIHGAALSILERTGLRFDNDEAALLFKKAGARVRDGHIVHIPGRLVEWALSTAPKSVCVYNRRGDLAMDLGDTRNYYGPGSDCAHLYDLATGERRQARLSDLADALTIADALPQVDFAMSMVMPADAPLGRHEYYQMEAMLAGTTKPIVFVGESEHSTRCAAEMMAEVRGGFDQLAARPLGVNYINSVSPFIHNNESVKRLIYGARLGLPTVYQPGQGRGTVGPVTPAGNVALGQAAQMGALVLHQLAREGAPMIRALPGEGMLDLKTMVSLYMSPDMGRLGWQVAKLGGLPLFGTAGMSDAKIFDGQATAEAAMSLVYNSLYGANLIHDLGYLDSAMTYSFELLVLCDEVIGWLRHHLSPPEISDETLALDLIDQLGHTTGNFLPQRHTLKHLPKCCWTPQLFDRHSHVQWRHKGGRPFEHQARDRARRLLETHRPEPLPGNLRSALTGIREKYARD